MKVIDFNTISKLGVNPLQCVKWVEYILKNKYSCELPPKISLHMGNNIFMNTMPSYIPMVQRHGVKIVSRYPERVPSLISEIMLYDTNNGLPLALMDGTWITAMRTGAVAALTIKTLQRKDAQQYAFMGLGNTARSTLLCLANFKMKVGIGGKSLFKQFFLTFVSKKFDVYICPFKQLCQTE